MNSRKLVVRLAAALTVLCASLASMAAAAPAGEDATLLRVFLKDGTSLVSYGEPAKVGDRVVFSMPTAATPNPPLHLVTIGTDRVDWERTDRYAASAREARYLETQAELDYAALSNQVTATLNRVTQNVPVATRVALVEAARRTLAEWPAGHYNYRRTEVQQMLTLLDEVIADLRAASGGERFSLNMLVFADPPTIREPLLPSLTEKETIEQTLSAARVVETAADREDLLKTALTTIDRSVVLPAGWAATTRAAAVAQLVEERRVDRSYRLLTQGIMAVAAQQASMADVRGLQRLELRIEQRDRMLGGKRPEVVTSLVAAVEAQLDAARRLRLARDRWALRAPVLRDYQLAMSTPLAQFAAIRTSLEDLKSLAGGSPLMLASVENSAELILRKSAAIVPPDELKSAHALLVSAAQLAQNAVAIRREAVLAGSMARAWDASSAAAGALMLGIQARRDIQASLRPPALR
jgi:hypothetical protein